MTPADPPPPAPDSPADVLAPAAATRRRRGAEAAGRPSPATEWTTSREEALECAGCGGAFVLSYKYRFVEGLAATVVRCPAPACRRGREYYLPVNAFDVLVAPAPGAASPPRP